MCLSGRRRGEKGWRVSIQRAHERCEGCPEGPHHLPRPGGAPDLREIEVFG